MISRLTKSTLGRPTTARLMPRRFTRFFMAYPMMGRSKDSKTSETQSGLIHSRLIYEIHVGQIHRDLS